MRFRKLACLLVVVISPALASATNTHVLSQRDGPITISGTVTGPLASGVADAVVEAFYPWDSASSATTDSDGYYQVSMAPGPIWLTVRAPLDSRLAGYVINLGYQEADLTQDFQLEAGHLLGGHVVMPDGNAGQEQIEVVLHAFSFDASGEDSTYLLTTRTKAGGEFEIVVPVGVYWAGVTPPEYYYSIEEPVDLRLGDIGGFVLSLSEELVDPIPVNPPDTSKITFGDIDELGEATVTGASGACLGLAHVLLVNLGSLHQAHAISAADGSFSTRLFAPAGSVILIKHGGLPAGNWRDVNTGVSMDKSPYPGSIVHLPHTHSPDPGTIPFAVVGPGDYKVDFLPESPNWVSTGYVLSGSLGPLGVLNPGDQITIDGTLRVYGPAIDSSTELDDLLFSGEIGLWMLSDGDGRPVAGNGFGMSTWLTPTGFPIQGFPGPGRTTGIFFAVTEFTSSGEHSVQAQLEIRGELPADLQPGLYRPFFFANLGGFPQSTDWTAAEVSSNAFEPPMAALPPIEVSAGGEEPRRLIWRLLMENPVQGTRGTGAIEDRGAFEFSQYSTSQGAPYIIPPVDRYGEPIRYRMEPYLPRISF
ncbi:MAG: carboxypeptidase-like regulatory domain-containing protein, partial [Acidobacteriota bacterium]